MYRENVVLYLNTLGLFINIVLEEGCPGASHSMVLK